MKKTSGVTEREVVSEIKEEFNKLIKEGWTPFENATVETRAGDRYPDLTVWTDYESKKAFAIWEFKKPGLTEDLSTLPSKARALGCQYVIVWNFQTGHIFEANNGNLQLLKTYPVPVLNSLEEWSSPSRRDGALKQARRIFDDLIRLAEGEQLSPYVPDKFYFIGILEKAIFSLVPLLESQIFQKKKDPDISRQLDIWTVEQGYPTALPDLNLLLARHWAYSLAVRILFYFTVRRYYPSLPELNPSYSQKMEDLLLEAFRKAQSVDWQAVFGYSSLDNLGLPDKAEPVLRELLDDFNRYDFSQLKEDVIGLIMEGLIPKEERHGLGQYFTRQDLVDFIIGFVARSDNAFYLDPTCGSGTFLNRLYSRLRWLSDYCAPHGQLLERIWGVDIVRIFQPSLPPSIFSGRT